MYKQTERNLEEAYNHIKNYMKHEDTTEELKEMCSVCELYSGSEHDYEECRNKMCFKFWLAFQYLEWSNAFR